MRAKPVRLRNGGGARVIRVSHSRSPLPVPRPPSPMTSPERRALLFLSAVALAGGGVRLAREWAPPPPPGDTRRALARQIEAVDSAKRAETHKGARGSSERKRASSSGKRSPDLGLQAARTGEAASSSLVPRPPALVPHPSPLLDIDVATSAELEALPRIGPALAARIVRDRDSLGPFGSLGALERVKGVGPALAAAIASRVTFSGMPRPVNAVLGPPSGVNTAAARAPRRRKKS